MNGFALKDPDDDPEYEAARKRLAAETGDFGLALQRKAQNHLDHAATTRELVILAASFLGPA
jgi:hypothetical protein